MNQLFTVLLIQPLTNVLVAIYQFLILLHIPFALGFSIIFLTVFVRFVLYPFTISQLRTSKKMQELAPHLSKIREKHKNDMQKQQLEQLALYKAHGVNPASGCFLLLLQLPLLIGLYNVLLKIVNVKSVNEINDLLYFDALKLDKLWETTFFGLPLGKTPADLLSTVGPLIFLVAIITGVLQFVQSRMMVPPAAETQKNNKKEDDFATVFQKQSLYIIPVMIGAFSHTFPLGLSLYWNTFTVFGIIQQYIHDRGKK